MFFQTVSAKKLVDVVLQYSGKHVSFTTWADATQHSMYFAIVIEHQDFTNTKISGGWALIRGATVYITHLKHIRKSLGQEKENRRNRIKIN